MERVKIKEFAKVITGGTPSTTKAEYWEGGEIPWLNSGELNQKIVTKSSNFITKIGLEKCSARLMPIDTVLIALTGSTTGVVGYLTFEACANQSVTGILPSTKHDPKYLYYFLNSIRPKVLNDAYGGAQPHISQAYVKDLEIPLPSLSTQKTIAAKLDKAQEIISYNKQLVEKYDQLTQSLFIDMFGDPVRNEKGWERVNLGKVCNKITDGTHDTPARLKSGIKFITGKHIKPYFIDYKNSDYVTEIIHKEIYRRCNPEFQDVLYTNIGVNFGTAALNIVHYEFSMKNVALLKQDKNMLNGQFLTYLLNDENFKDRLKSTFGIGGAQQFLSLANIKKIEVLLPPISLQNQFAERVEKIEFQKQMAQETLTKSEHLFQSLLKESFR